MTYDEVRNQLILLGKLSSTQEGTVSDILHIIKEQVDFQEYERIVGAVEYDLLPCLRADSEGV